MAQIRSSELVTVTRTNQVRRDQLLRMITYEEKVVNQLRTSGGRVKKLEGIWNSTVTVIVVLEW